VPARGESIPEKSTEKKNRSRPTVFNPYPSPHRTNPAATNPPLLNSSLSFSPPLRLRRLFLSASSLLLPLPATPHLLLSSRRLEPGALLPRVATGGSASPPLASSPLPWGRGRARRWQAAAARYPRSGVLDGWIQRERKGRGGGGGLVSQSRRHPFLRFFVFLFFSFLVDLICDELAANPWVGLRIR
jgi:hypothetical protein